VVPFLTGCKKDPRPPDDLNVLSAEGDRAEVKELAQKYPEAGITPDEPIADALRAALRASEAKNQPPQAPREPGSQAAKLLENTGK
jgi:hypothetical protein